MAYSYIKYTSNGSTANYTFAFPYIDSTHVKVLLNDVPSTAFTLLGGSAITLSPVPIAGVSIEIRRETPKDNPIVNFTDGSVLLEADLDLMVLFNTYVAQETWDRSDVVIAKSDLAIAAGAQAKAYADLAFKYERLASDHNDNANDSEDRSKIYKELAASFSGETKTAAVTIEADRAEVAANTATVAGVLSDVLIAKGLISAQAQLASAILEQSKNSAIEAQGISNTSLSTAQQVATTVSALNATAATVSTQQIATLAAKGAAESARDAAVVAKTSSEAASATATTQAGIASTKASEAVVSASGASTSASTATTKATNASSSATSSETARVAAVAARDAAQGFAASIDVSTKANLASPTFTGTVSGITAGMVGLGSVNNTADADKPISTATATALSGKQVAGTYATGSGTASGINTGDQVLPTLASLGGYSEGNPAGYTTNTGDVTLTGTQTLTNKTLQAPNITTGLTLGGAAGTVGQTLTSAGAGAAPTWASPAGAQTLAINSNTTLSSGNQYLVDTSLGAITVALPASPVMGNAVAIYDANGMFDVCPLLLNPNGSLLAFRPGNVSVNEKNRNFFLRYNGTTWVFEAILNRSLPLTNATSTTYSITGGWNAQTGMGFGKGIFVALTWGAYAITSPDGITWTQRTLPSVKNWSSVAYGNGKFVAVSGYTAYSSSAAYSTDGITWTAADCQLGKWTSIAYGAGVYVSVSYNSSSAQTSVDGITWISRALGSTTSWQRVVYGNGIFVAIDDGTASGTLTVNCSALGTSWSPKAVTANTNTIEFGNGVFVCVGYNTNATYISADGISWTTITNNLPMIGPFNRTVFCNGTFFAFSSSGTNYIYSNDGLTWNQMSTGTTVSGPVSTGNGVIAGVNSLASTGFQLRVI